MTTNELRIAVGRPDGPRSTVWKFFTTKNDAYIMTRMFGSDSKVSLHASGEYRWSATSEWVQRDSRRRNADRHMVRWTTVRPTGNTAQHAFRIIVPESELRSIPPGEDIRGVRWLPAPPIGAAFALECYITPPMADPSRTANLPFPHIVSLPLRDEVWFVVLVSQVTIGEESLRHVRAQITAQARAAGIVPAPEHRAAAFMVHNAGPRGLVELALL